MRAREILDTVEDQMRVLRRDHKVPSYVILDKDSFKILRGGVNRRDYLWYGYECVDTNAPDTLCGLIISVLPGASMNTIIEVRE